MLLLRIWYEQVEQSLDYRCVLVCTCTATCSNNCIFTRSLVQLLLKCYLDCLTIPFILITIDILLEIGVFFIISTRLWPTDGPTDQRTDTPSYRDARTHLKMKRCESFSLIGFKIRDKVQYLPSIDQRGRGMKIYI